MNPLHACRLARPSLPLLLGTTLALIAPLLVSGCGSGVSTAPASGRSPSDEELIKAQKSCPVTGEPLGSMGKPAKVMVGGEPVFLCCASCKDKALADPGQTLSKVKELKGKEK